MSVLGQVQKSGVGLLKNLFRSRSLSLITLALLAGAVLSPLIASLGLLAVAGVASGSLGKSFMSILTKSSSSQAVSPSAAKDSGKTAAAEKAAKKAAPAIPTGNALVDALITKLLACHLDVTTDWGTAKEVINELPESYDHIKNKMDDIRGFVFCNKIFINPDGVQADVPIHEYTHVWAEALRQQNDKEWKNIVELLKEETVLWEEIKAKYPHLSSDNEIADRVLADLLKGVNPSQYIDKAKKQNNEVANQMEENVNRQPETQKAQEAKEFKEVDNERVLSDADIASPKHQIREAIVERILNPSSDATFTKEQQDTIISYLKDYPTVDGKLQALSPLWQDAEQDSRVKGEPKEWFEPVKEELNDLASGIRREPSEGLKLK